MSPRADATIGLSGQLVHKEVHLCSPPCLQCFLKTIQSLMIDIFLRQIVSQCQRGFVKKMWKFHSYSWMDIDIITKLLKLFNVCSHTCVKTPTPLVSCIVNDALVHSMPNVQQTLLRCYYLLWFLTSWTPIIYKTMKMINSKLACALSSDNCENLTGSCDIFWRIWNFNFPKVVRQHC